MSNNNKTYQPYARTPALLLTALSCGMGSTAAHFFGIDNIWGVALIIFIGFTVSLFVLTLTATPHHGAKNSLSSTKGAPDTVKLARKNLETAIAEGLQEAIFIIDRNALITYANLAARRLFPELTLKQPLSTYVPNPAVSDLITATLDGSMGTPLSIIRPGSVDRHIRISGTPIISQKNGEDVIKRAVIILADVTEIERTNTQRADFLANASHELKTPIASMLGYIETLRGHAKDDPAAQEMFLGIMQEQAERMQRLITDILSLRKIELAEHLVPMERADFGLAAKAALEAVHPIAKMRKVKVRLSGKKKNALVMGRQDELVQLALNLVDNAVRMSPEDSRIQLEMDKIEAWVPGTEFREAPFAKTAQRRSIVLPPRTDIPYWRLTVRDAGPGFKADHLPRLGERFYRIAGDRSSKEKGTGLGLAIVKHIVRWHRGGLYIESAEGKGTEFTIIIPIADDPDEAHITPDPLPIERGAS